MNRASWALVALLVGIVLAGVYRMGYRHAAETAYRVRTDTIRLEIARLDTVYRRDTVVFWRMKRVVDTLVRVDSIPVIARDSARADSALRLATSTIASCSVALLTCEERVARERQLRLAAEGRAGAPAAPSLRLPVLAGVAGVLVGTLTTLLLRR